MRQTVSLCIPYYEDPNRLRGILLNECLGWFDEVVIVDDGSTSYPAEPILKEFEEELPSNLSAYAIQTDYGFNAHGARNLAATYSMSDWLFFMDVDQELNADVFLELKHEIKKAKPKQFFLCNLFGDDPGNIFCVRAIDFWRAGGYDEELRGFHMGDKIFRERLDSFCEPILLKNILPCNRMGRTIRVDNTVLGTYYPDDRFVVQRSQNHIQEELDMIKERNKDPSRWESIPHLNFEWKKII